MVATMLMVRLHRSDSPSVMMAAAMMMMVLHNLDSPLYDDDDDEYDDAVYDNAYRTTQ